MDIWSSTGKYRLRFGIVLLLTWVLSVPLSQLVHAADNVQAAPKQQNISERDTTLPTTLTVTLMDEGGAPLSGISLSAMAADFTGRTMDTATTDQNGKAVFKRLLSGSYYFFANINEIRRHAGYGMPAMVREFKTSRSYFLSESRQFDLSADTETTFIIKRGAYIWFETYLQVVRSGKIIVNNAKSGVQQIIPVASTDYIQIYLPMRSVYQIITIKDGDFDSWIMEFYAHERLRIELL